MAIVLDPVGKRIVLDSATYTAKALYVAWVDWFVQGDNSKYLPAFRTAGGDDLLQIFGTTPEGHLQTTAVFGQIMLLLLSRLRWTLLLLF